MMKLETWLEIVKNKDMDTLREHLSEDVLFYSPAFHKPKQGKDALILILSTVIEVFENFTYHRQLSDGSNLFLEFSANIGTLDLKGIDLIGLNAEGKIQTFEVMVRPGNALQALAMAMMEKLDGQF